MSDTVKWSRRLAALAQTQLTFAKDEYDQERGEELQQLAADMMEASTNVSSNDPCHAVASGEGGWKKIFENESGYATPKVDVRGAVFKNGKVLLSKELSDGRWSLPGGWADVNDTPSEAVIREVSEETGYPVKCIKLAAVLDRDLHYQPETSHAHPFHIYKLLFVCEIVGEPDELCHDITDSAFFDLDDLPPLSMHRTLPKHIDILRQHHQNPDLPTAFD